MPQEPELILGLDLGTSSLKAALFDREGRVHGSADAPLSIAHPAPGWAEQAPDDWVAAAAQATRRLLERTDLPAASVRAVGLCAQMCGLVAVDQHADALHPALIWLDTRSRHQARSLMRGWPKLSGYGLWRLLRWLRLTNGAPNLSGRDPISKLLWLRDEQPAAYAAASRFLDVKDYLLWRLTGRFATTPDCAHLTWLFDSRPGRRRWSPALLDAAGLSSDRLPEVIEATRVAGGLLPEAAALLGLEPGIPVSGGAGDLVACGLGAGCYGSALPHLYIGTSSWLAAFGRRPRVDVFSGIGTISGPGRNDYLLVATQESAGACVSWGCHALAATRDGRPDFAEFDRLAATSTAGADGVMFLPWLHGERVPFDDPNLRGGFVRAALSTTRGDLARAVLEGVALNIRWALEPFRRSHGRPIPLLRLIGGAARSTAWCQLLADVLQLPLEVTAEPQLAGARGAALTAAQALGWITSLEQGDALVPIAHRYRPDPALAALFATRLAAFKRQCRGQRRAAR